MQIREGLMMLYPNFKKAIDANPNKAELHYSLGVVYANKKEYDNAERELETAISINPGNIQAHYVLAMIYEKKKKNDKAVSEWQKVSDLTQEKELKKHAEKHIKRLKETK
jgi:Tfp pilus assembly protein PilF